MLRKMCLVITLHGAVESVCRLNADESDHITSPVPILPELSAAQGRAKLRALTISVSQSRM